MFLKGFILLCSVVVAFAAAELKYEIRYMNDVKPRMDNQTIQKTVNDALKIQDRVESYLKVGVNVYTLGDGRVDYFVVNLFRADIYLLLCYKLELDGSRVVKVIDNFVEPQIDSDVCYACPDNELEALFSTSLTEVNTAKEAIDSAAVITERLGLKTKKLLYAEQTVANIKNYLQCPKLAIWGSVCHGNASIVQMYDGQLNVAYFQSLAPSGLKDKTIILNSCLSHNTPFEPAVLSAGTYFFASGDGELQSTFSENVFKAFIYKAVEQKMEMGQAFTEAEAEVGYSGYGWSGDASGPPYYFKGETTPYVQILAPLNGDSWGRGSYNKVKWQSNLQGKVKIELIKGTSSVATLKASTDNDGLDTVLIAENTALGSDYKIKISGVAEPTIIGESKVFSIIEDVIITLFPYTLDFDKQLSLPNGWMQEKNDDFDWYFISGPTPSRNGQSGEEANKTGPLADHTSGFDYYIYMEASSNNPSKQAALVTTKFNIKQLPNPTLDFWVHMYSAKDEMGALYVDVCVDGVWSDDITHVTGNQGDKWIEVTKSLAQYVGERVYFRLRGVTGTTWCSDIAIDDFKVCEGTTAITTTQSDPPSYGLSYRNSTLVYRIPARGSVDINLYSVQGRMLYSLVNGFREAGLHSISLEGGMLSAGSYICSMKAGGFSKTVTVIIPK